MSNSQIQNPFMAMFRMQRNTMEQGQRMFHQSMEMQQQMYRAFLNSMDAQKSAQRQANMVGRSAVDAYFEMLEASMPGDSSGFSEMREAVHDQIAAYDDISDQTWDAFERSLRANVDATDEFIDNMLEFVDESYEAFEDSQRSLQEATESAAESMDAA